jgi:hypothetical protein
VTAADPIRDAIRKKQATDQRRALALFGRTPPADEAPDGAEPVAPPPTRVSAGAGTRQEPAPPPADFDSTVRAIIARARQRFGF